MIEILNLVVFALGAIGKLAQNPGVGQAEAVLEAVAQIYESVEGAVVGKVTPDEAQERIEILLADLRSNDAAADAALAARFPPVTK